MTNPLARSAAVSLALLAATIFLAASATTSSAIPPVGGFSVEPGPALVNKAAVQVNEPLEDDLFLADVVVTGKITAEDKPFRDGPSYFRSFTLTVAETLKGTLTEKTLRIAKPATDPDSKVLSLFFTGPAIALNDAGLFMLKPLAATAKDVPSTYVLPMSGSVRKLDLADKDNATLKAAREMADAQKTFAGGKAVNGLEARLVVRGTPASDRDEFAAASRMSTTEVTSPEGVIEAFIELRNASNKPITICTYIGTHPTKLVLSPAHGGAKSDEGNPDLLAAPVKMPIGPMKGDYFVTLAPGQRHQLLRQIFRTERAAGKYFVGATFKWDENIDKVAGLTVDPKTVWRGEVRSNVLAVKIGK